MAVAANFSFFFPNVFQWGSAMIVRSNIEGLSWQVELKFKTYPQCVKYYSSTFSGAENKAASLEMSTPHLIGKLHV